MQKYFRGSKILNRVDVVAFAILACAFVATLVLTIHNVAIPAIAQDPGEPPEPVAPIDLAPLPEGADVFYASSASLLVLASEANTEGSSETELIAWPEQPVAHTEDGHVVGSDGGTKVGRTHYCEDGNEAVVQMYFGPYGKVWSINATDQTNSQFQPITDAGWSLFLGWHPDCEHVLVRVEDVDVTEPGLWLVNVKERTHTFIKIPDLVAPEGLLDAEFSPDGSQLVYAISKGMGFGSEVGLLDMKTQEHRQLRSDEAAVVSSLNWSPDGARIAFTTLVDSPVPFAEAGIWQMQAKGNEQSFLARMDGGHGHEPIWSHDSQNLLFVARDNADDRSADYEADALLSSIQSVDTNTGEVSVLVEGNGARNIDLDLMPNGELLFASDRKGAAGESGVLEIWQRSPQGELRQLTQEGANKRYPAYAPIIPER